MHDHAHPHKPAAGESPSLDRNISFSIGLNALSPLAMLMLFSLFWSNPLRSRLWTLALPAFAVYGVCRIVNW